MPYHEYNQKQDITSNHNTNAHLNTLNKNQKRISHHSGSQIFTLASKISQSFCWSIKHWLVSGQKTFRICRNLMNHPVQRDHQVEVCFQSQETELNMKKQRSVIMHHISGTNSLKTAGPGVTFLKSRLKTFLCFELRCQFSLDSFKPILL